MRFILASACLLILSGLAVAAADKPLPPAPQANRAYAPFATGAMKKLDFSKAGTPAPSEALERPGGRKLTLEAYRGKVVVLNLWATWCAPCIRELPSLNALQKATAADGVVVVAASMDRGGWRAVDPFWAKAKLDALVPHLDKSTMLAFNMKAKGLPLTLVYDRSGREIARLAGDADWSSKQARAFIKAVAQS